MMRAFLSPRLLLLAAALVALAALFAPGPQPAQAQEGEPPPGVSNLRCLVAETDLVAFMWEEPSWSGGEVYDYYYEVSLPDGRKESGSIKDSVLLKWPGSYEGGQEARLGIVVNYDAADGSRVSSGEETASCYVKGEPPTPEPEEPAGYRIGAAARVPEGDSAALTITLSEAAPASGVEFTVAAGYDGGSATAEDVGSMTSPVTVPSGSSSLDILIPTVDDRIDENEESFTVVIATDAEGWEPAGEGRDTATVTITDDDTAGMRVAAANPLNVAEGESATYTVVLESQPTHDVTITAASGDDGAAAVTPASHVFTPSDWSAPKSFTVSGVADDDSADETVGISHQVTSHDGKYAVIPVSTVAVAVTEPAQPQKQVSSDASLSGLELSSYSYEGQPTPVIPLRPGFDAATTAYGATVPTYTGSVRVRATANDAGATVTVNGQRVASGAYSGSMSLIPLKENEPLRIEVSVTAEDGTTRRVYAIAATRDPRAGLSGLEISHGKLHPFFTPDHGAYQAWVPYSVEGVSFTPTNGYASGTIRVAGDEVSSGEASAPVPLQVGENVIKVTATAPDEYTVKTYTITVVRVSATASSDATLRGLEVFPTTHTGPDAADVVHHEGTGYQLTPALTAGVTEYTVRAPEDVEYVAVTATTTAAGAKTIVVQGPPVSNVEARPPKGRPVSGEASGPWAPFVGHAMISIAVTSLGGENTETYRVTVTQGTVAAPSEVELTQGDGTLTLSWAEQEEDSAAARRGIGALARWREAGTETWLNGASLSGFKRTYAADAPSGTAADGARVTTKPLVIRGLENGTEYEVELRRTRGGHSSHRVMNWLSSEWVTLRGTPALDPPALTALVITPNNATREYGGADDLSYTVGGLASGDAAADVVTGTLTRAAGEEVGSYAFDLSHLTISAAYADRYRLPAAASIANYTITPKAITAISGVTVNTRPSDGTTDATFDTTNAEGTGVLSAELADFRAGGLQVSGAFQAATAGTHSLSVTYSLQDQGSFKAANYTLSTKGDTLHGGITPAQTRILVITPTNPIREYGGTDDLRYTVGGLAQGDEATSVVSGALSRVAGDDVGTYAINMGTLAIAPAYASKYGLPASPAVANYTIAPKAITAISGVTVNTRPSDGTTAAAFDTTNAEGTGVLPAELADFRVGGLQVGGFFPAATAGTHSLSVTYSLQDHGSFEANNYALSATTGTLQGELSAGNKPVGGSTCAPSSNGDYDSDDDSFIEVCSLAQLNAIRWDPDGDGQAANSPEYVSAWHAAAFPNAVAGMGCPQTGCKGYELVADLDFEGNDWPAGASWVPIGLTYTGGFAARFQGNGHTIRNLYVAPVFDGPVGLFESTSSSAVIIDLNLESASINARRYYSDDGGVLVGNNSGTIINTHVSGVVRGRGMEADWSDGHQKAASSPAVHPPPA